jgi:predicted Zn-dependent protease with MMP-like domain
MYQVERERMEEMVWQTVNGLPDEFKERIANLEFSVEDHARPEDYGLSGAHPGTTLLGVYRGIPLTRRTSRYGLTLPDRIVVFQAPLQRLARGEADLERRVARVVRHEIAHYFGISDRRLHELGAY